MFFSSFTQIIKYFYLFIYFDSQLIAFFCTPENSVFHFYKNINNTFVDINLFKIIVWHWWWMPVNKFTSSTINTNRRISCSDINKRKNKKETSGQAMRHNRQNESCWKTQNWASSATVELYEAGRWMMATILFFSAKSSLPHGKQKWVITSLLEFCYIEAVFVWTGRARLFVEQRVFWRTKFELFVKRQRFLIIVFQTYNCHVIIH